MSSQPPRSQRHPSGPPHPQDQPRRVRALAHIWVPMLGLTLGIVLVFSGRLVLGMLVMVFSQLILRPLLTPPGENGDTAAAGGGQWRTTMSRAMSAPAIPAPGPALPQPQGEPPHERLRFQPKSLDPRDPRPREATGRAAPTGRDQLSGHDVSPAAEAPGGWHSPASGVPPTPETVGSFTPHPGPRVPSLAQLQMIRNLALRGHDDSAAQRLCRIAPQLSDAQAHAWVARLAGGDSATGRDSIEQLRAALSDPDTAQRREGTT